MSTASYNCPCCGGPLEFGGSSGKLECAACGNAFEMEALEALHSSENGEQISFERPRRAFGRWKRASRPMSAKIAARS